MASEERARIKSLFAAVEEITLSEALTCYPTAVFGIWELSAQYLM
jgi:hypothetical protein